MVKKEWDSFPVDRLCTGDLPMRNHTPNASGLSIPQGGFQDKPSQIHGMTPLTPSRLQEWEWEWKWLGKRISSS